MTTHTEKTTRGPKGSHNHPPVHERNLLPAGPVRSNEITLQGLAQPDRLRRQMILQLQRAAGNQAVTRLMSGAGHPTIQRAEGKIAPGSLLPSLESAAEGFASSNPTLDARFRNEALVNVANTVFMSAFYGQAQGVEPLTTTEKATFETIITDALIAPRLSTAQFNAKEDIKTKVPVATGPALMDSLKLRKKYSDWVDSFFKYTQQDSLRKFLAGGKTLRPLPANKKAAFADALKHMPTVARLLDASRVLPALVTTSGWKNGGKLSDTINESDEGDKGRTGHIIRTNVDNGVFKAQVDEADQLIRDLVDPTMLADIDRPGVVVHLKYNGGNHPPEDVFRAFEKPDAVHVAQDDGMTTIAHEVGHYLEDRGDPETWRDIQALLRQRNASYNKGRIFNKDLRKAGHGASRGETMRDEGRFRGTYAVTGKYTSSAYTTGATEVTSMTVEFLANPVTAKTIIEKDPQQAAIILRGLRHDEYVATHELDDFNDYMPQ